VCTSVHSMFANMVSRIKKQHFLWPVCKRTKICLVNSHIKALKKCSNHKGVTQMRWSKWGHHCTSSLDMLSTWALHTADLAMVSAPETIQICWRCINCTDHNRLRSSGLAEKKAVLYFLSTEIVALPFAMDANSFRYLDFIKKTR
jgi:hypothetical protein